MSTSFGLSGKFSFFNISLKKLGKTPAKAFELIFNVLGGIVSLLVALFSLINWTSFSMSNLDIG